MIGCYVWCYISYRIFALSVDRNIACCWNLVTLSLMFRPVHTKDDNYNYEDNSRVHTQTITIWDTKTNTKILTTNLKQLDLKALHN